MNAYEAKNDWASMPLPPFVKRSLRNVAAYVLRRLPPVRGRQRLGVAVNQLCWPTDDDAIVTAPMKLGYKMIVDLRSYLEYRSFYSGDYGDPVAVKACLRLLNPDSVVLDVGANVGFMTVPLAQKVHPAGAIFAFEPIARNCRRLRDNLKLNGLLRDDTVFPIGLSDRAAQLRVSLRGDFQAGGSTGNAAIIEGSDRGDDMAQVETIEVESLDTLFPRLNRERLDFMKVDIEGHEMAFLEGAAAVIARFRPVIYTEVNDWYFALRGLRAADLFSAWARDHRYRIAAVRAGRIEWIALEHAENLQTDVFLVPSERADWFLSTVN